jgi:hypothetical protein
MPPFEGRYALSPGGRGFINIYRSFTDQAIWPRGFPLDRVTDPGAVLSETDLHDAPIRVGVWQGLADGDPDVDAVYRLTVGTACRFRERDPIVLAPGTLCPFNSQNTAFCRPLFPLLYLPAHVSFRFTDILRGLVAQPILWLHGYHLGFTAATVFQERNPHDYLKDFESEIPCYLYPHVVIETVTGALRPGGSVADHLHQAYEALHRRGIVPAQELAVLSAWLEDVA